VPVQDTGHAPRRAKLAGDALARVRARFRLELVLIGHREIPRGGVVESESYQRPAATAPRSLVAIPDEVDRIEFG
jgi:hypothetical protein